MNFPEALELLKQGKKVTRSSYKQKALFSAQLPEIITIMPHWELIYPNNNTMGSQPLLASTYQTPLTGADLVAIDWIEYEPVQASLPTIEEIETKYRDADQALITERLAMLKRTPIWDSNGKLTGYYDATEEPRIETPKHIRDIYEPPIKDSQS